MPALTPFSRRSFARTVSAAAIAASLGPRAFAQSTTVFKHGVASGDPLINRVIIWTRVSPIVSEEIVPVEWVVAEDAGFSRVYQRGLTYTSEAFDYTVKVDVQRLSPNTTYYYQFTVRGVKSPIGRAKTLPVGDATRIRFAVASCSNLPYGYFNAYRMIANRADLDFVLHLGDYLYEYANTAYGDGTRFDRVPQPNKEITSLSDYRLRYAQYRQDPDLQEVHRQHTFITVWDDHETANNSWTSGAENHDPATQGSWSARRAYGTQAYSEWMPIRENVYEDSAIYRSFRAGNLLDLVMLDSRLAGRDQQVAEQSPLVAAPGRSLLGFEQEEWFYRQLLTSKARGSRWRIIGQQTMMGQLINTDGTPFSADQWDGYIASRNRFLQQLAANQINNVVVLSGDIHSSWGNEITANPFGASGYTSQAVEFVGPAITSPGIDDLAQATGFAQLITATHPHVKFVDLFRRGYMVVDIDRDRAQAEWYHVRTITERAQTEDLARVLRTGSGENRLVSASASAAPSAPPLAP